MLIQDYLDICDPVLTFDRFMGEIELEKYLKNIPQHYTGRLRYDPVSMLKTVLFGFMANGYISLRELEDQCKINLRFMYLSKPASEDKSPPSKFILICLLLSNDKVFTILINGSFCWYYLRFDTLIISQVDALFFIHLIGEKQYSVKAQ